MAYKSWAKKRDENIKVTFAPPSGVERGRGIKTAREKKRGLCQDNGDEGEH